MSLPEDFITSTRQLMGDSLYERLMAGLASDPSVSVRLNPFKGGLAISDISVGHTPVPWCAEGAYLDCRPNFTSDPLLHAGAYYVQDASSMFVCHVLRQLVDRPVLMLDLCAAPGGKSTAARAVLPQGSMLFANEPMRQRANVLDENLQKFGHPDVVVTNSFPREYRKSRMTFDVVLADVPCSGEGMFRKDEGAVADWSRRKVEECASLQRDIVSDVWHCLCPGGLLIYSTCTFNADENERNAMWIAENLGGDFVSIPIEDEWGITGAMVGEQPCYRFLPGLTRGEGLFMTVIRKHGEASSKPRKGRDKGAERKKARTALACSGLTDNDAYTVMEHEGRVFAVRKEWADSVTAALRTLNVMTAGVTLGTRRGKDLVPAEALALSAQIDKAAYHWAEVSRGDALRYLRREALTLGADVPTGYVGVCHRGLPLGFVKNMGCRSNNLYPAEWRIRSSHVAEQKFSLVDEARGALC